MLVRSLLLLLFECLGPFLVFLFWFFHFFFRGIGFPEDRVAIKHQKANERAQANDEEVVKEEVGVVNARVDETLAFLDDLDIDSLENGQCQQSPDEREDVDDQSTPEQNFKENQSVAVVFAKEVVILARFNQVPSPDASHNLSELLFEAVSLNHGDECLF